MKTTHLIASALALFTTTAALTSSFEPPAVAQTTKVTVRGVKIVSGSTIPGATGWQTYGAYSVYVDVNTAAAGFTTTPPYVISLGCYSNCWDTTGGSSVYNATPTGFRVFVRFADDRPISPADANALGWHINWTAVGR